LYRTSSVHGVATALEALGFTVEMIPNVMVARQLEEHFCMVLDGEADCT
jgi:ceramide glucosyltransferase